MSPFASIKSEVAALDLESDRSRSWDLQWYWVIHWRRSCYRKLRHGFGVTGIVENLKVRGDYQYSFSTLAVADTQKITEGGCLLKFTQPMKAK